jgi:hypothetical protein
MKNLPLMRVCVVVALMTNLAFAQREYIRRPAKPIEIESFIFSDKLWDTKIADFEKDAANKKFNFKWQSADKNGLRSEGHGFKMLDIKAGECVIISDGGNELKGISLSFYNKGDNGYIDKAKFSALTNEVRDKVTEKLSTKPRTEEKKTTVTLNQSQWIKGNTSYQLDSSVSNEGDPDFLRFRIMSTTTAKRGEATADRTSLRANVVKDHKTGEVFIDNIPMVDQGQKGYCACASAARIYQYYGRTTDQHEIAQIAGSSAHGGTSIAEMVGALKKVTSSLNSRVNILYEYPKGLSDKDFDDRAYRNYILGAKEMMRDINSYQQLAKKTGAKSIPFEGVKEYGRIPNDMLYSFDYFIYKCEPKTFREVMMKKSSFSRFNSKIKEYIDQGIPVGWCLQLGLFPEKGMEQATGGHMRLIIGYNEKTKEIIFSDSWGEGHSKKTMDAGEAFSMTNVILVLPPTK